ncbi:MAG: hypothetical protein RIF46_11405 [Cyclobacteriaceae bacterium]
MKSLFVSLLVIASVSCFSQNAKERANDFLADKLGAFTATSESESKVLDDGAMRIERAYTSGEKSLEIEINIPKGKEEFAKVQSEIDEIMGMFQEMSAEGKMDFSPISDNKVSGALTFSEGRGSAIIIAYNRFVVEIKLKGISGIDEFKTFFDSLEFDNLQKAKG